MAKDIDVDISELERFIEVMCRFQEQTTERLQSLQQVWQGCDETWEGRAKEEFARNYEETEKVVIRALEAGSDAIAWLYKYREILGELEGY